MNGQEPVIFVYIPQANSCLYRQSQRYISSVKAKQRAKPNNHARDSQELNKVIGQPYKTKKA